MAQGNPFQDWSGSAGGGSSSSAAAAVAVDDPFGQFLLQRQPSTQEQQLGGSSQQNPQQQLGLSAGPVPPQSHYAPPSAVAAVHKTPTAAYHQQFYPPPQGNGGVSGAGDDSAGAGAAGLGGAGVNGAADNPFDSLFASHGHRQGTRFQPTGVGGGDAFHTAAGISAPSPSSSAKANGMTVAGVAGVGDEGVGSAPAAMFQSVSGQPSVAQQQFQQQFQKLQVTPSPSRFPQQPVGYEPQQQQQQQQQQRPQIQPPTPHNPGMTTPYRHFHHQDQPAQPSPASTAEGSTTNTLVPFGHPFDPVQQQQHQQQGGHTSPLQGATTTPAVGPGAIVPFQQPQQQQQKTQPQQQQWAQGGDAAAAPADNPFDDLFSSAVVPYGNGTASSGNASGNMGGSVEHRSIPLQQQQQQQHQLQPQWQMQQQPQQQNWRGGRFAGQQNNDGNPNQQGGHWLGGAGHSGGAGDVMGMEQQGASSRPPRPQQQAESPFQQHQNSWSGQSQAGWTSHAQPQQQHAQHFRPQQGQQQQQQPFQGNSSQQVLQRAPGAGNAEFNPFGPSLGEHQVQQPHAAGTGGVGPTPSPAGFDVFSDDPFGGNTSVLTTTDEGFVALTGAGGTGSQAKLNPDGFDASSGANSRSGASHTAPVSGNDPFDPFDLASFTPDFVGAGAGGGGAGGGGGNSRSGVGTAGDVKPGGRGQSRPLSARQGGKGHMFLRKAGAPPTRDGGHGREGGKEEQYRSSSVPRGVVAGRRRPSESDPFEGNSGRHGWPAPRGDGSSQRNRRSPHGSSSPTSAHRGALSRSNTMGDVFSNALSGGDRGRHRDRENSRSGGDSSLGRGRGSASAQNVLQTHRGDEFDNYDDEDDEEEEDIDYGSDSDNDDTMSVMDPDAVRAAMGARGYKSGFSGRGKDSPAEYCVEFERERKLGMLLERHDEWSDGSEVRSERAVVKMVVDNGPAQTRGVTVGSKVKKVNGEGVTGLTYQETLERIKHAARPLRVQFERGELVVDDNVGQILFKKTVGVPRSFSAWQRRYFVLGGAVAKSNVLQVYVSKQSYDRMVLAVFGRQRIHERVKAYKLNNMYKCSAIKVRKYKGHPSPLNYFTVKLPTSRLKQLNFASHSLSDLQHLRSTMSRFTSRS